MKKVFIFFAIFSFLFGLVKAETTLEEIEKSLSKVETIQAEFKEEKSLAVFNDTITLKGKLYLKKPHLLAWKVDSPLKYSLVINKDEILQWDAESKSVQKISLKEKPVFDTIINQMQSWFYGEYSKLLNDYNMTKLQESPPILKFEPKQGASSYEIIEQVTVFFKENTRYIDKIQIRESSGDKTSLNFLNVRINQPIDESVWKVIP